MNSHSGGTPAAPVTVVIPCYNAGQLITRALRSVARQNVSPSEVLVVDDGSTIPVEGVVDEFHRNHPELSMRVIRKTNGGPSSARNLGVELATQELIAFLDSDDEMSPGHLSSKVPELLQLSPEYFGVYGTHADSEGRSPDLIESDGLIDPAQVGRAGGVPGGSSAYLFRKSTLVSVEGFDEDLVNNEDFDLLIRLSRAGYKCSGPFGASGVQHRQPVSVSRPVDPYVAFRHTERFLIKAEKQGYFRAEELTKRRRGARRTLAKGLLRRGRFLDASRELVLVYKDAAPKTVAERLLFLGARTVLLVARKSPQNETRG